MPSFSVYVVSKVVASVLTDDNDYFGLFIETEIERKGFIIYAEPAGPRSLRLVLRTAHITVDESWFTWLHVGMVADDRLDEFLGKLAKVPPPVSPNFGELGATTRKWTDLAIDAMAKDGIMLRVNGAHWQTTKQYETK